MHPFVIGKQTMSCFQTNERNIFFRERLRVFQIFSTHNNYFKIKHVYISNIVSKNKSSIVFAVSPT